MLDRFFGLRRNGTTVRTELGAGLTTFLTMAYIVVVQPLVKLLSGRGREVGWLMYVLALALVCYFVGVRARVG